MKKIKYNLEVCYKNDIHQVRFQLLHMPPNIKRGCGGVFSNGNFEIRSSNCPELSGYILFIGGTSKKLDHSVVVRVFDNEREANDYFIEITKLLEAYNATQSSWVIKYGNL